MAIEASAELLPIFEFALKCDSLGLHTPFLNLPLDSAVNPAWLWNPEMPLHADDLLFYTDLASTLALAQHHGLPTRLLDWTFEPMFAAFFATEALSLPAAGECIAVWALHRERANKVHTSGVDFPGATGMPGINPSIAAFRTPARENQYLTAQSGLFTAVSGSGVYFMQNEGRRPGVDELVIEAAPTMTILRKLVLPHEHVSDLKAILKRERISRSALMPTMDNIAAEIIQAASM